MSRNFQELTIKDSFMFAAVMSDENQCRELLELILEMKILQVTVNAEKSMSYRPDYHGVRMDVLAEEKGSMRRFNVEMQVKRKKDLPWRSRYYHSQLDMDALLSGKSYDHLPDTYIIFICDFVWLPDKLYRYTYETVCRENGAPLNQGQTTVFLSTKGRNAGDVPKELVDFLKYVGDPEKLPADMEADSFVAQVERRVQAIKANRDWEARFMLLELMLKDERKEGRRDGIFELLAMYGEIPEDIRSQINDETDETVLKRWLITAAKVSSIDEFREKMHG